MDIFVRTFLITNVLLTWSEVVNGRMNGADPTACMSLIPTGHGTTQQSTDSPFVIELSTTQYTPGGNIQGRYCRKNIVTLESVLILQKGMLKDCQRVKFHSKGVDFKFHSKGVKFILLKWI